MADLFEPKRGRGTYPRTPPCVRKPPRRTGWWSGCCCMARRWSSVRRVADMRCEMRVTPTPHMRVTHRCAAAEGSAGEGGFFSTHNEGDRCLHTRSYTRSPRGCPWCRMRARFTRVRFTLTKFCYLTSGNNLTVRIRLICNLTDTST